MKDHTRVPWHQYHTNVHRDRMGDVCRPVRDVVASCVLEENAEFIVLACNSHYDLLDALKRAVGIISDLHAGDKEGSPVIEEVLNEFETMIAMAEGRKVKG